MDATGTGPAEPSPSWDGFGQYLRAQRQLAKLTLRQLAAMADVSNPYLSQIERGLHKPSLAVMKSIADALNVSVDAMLQQAGFGPDPGEAAATVSTEAAIRSDPRLTGDQKSALLAVYRSMVGETAERAGRNPAAPRPVRGPADPEERDPGKTA